MNKSAAVFGQPGTYDHQADKGEKDRISDQRPGEPDSDFKADCQDEVTENDQLLPNPDVEAGENEPTNCHACRGCYTKSPMWRWYPTSPETRGNISHTGDAHVRAQCGVNMGILNTLFSRPLPVAER